MSIRQGDPLWEELGRIDYFLEHLARAVERGEAPLETYETLAPRYLARREEIVAGIQRRPVAASGAVRPAAPAPGAVRPASAPVAAPPAAAPAPAPVPARPPREVRWTQVLAYTGAFLVVVAAAIFTVAVWETVSTTAKLGFLGFFTAAFYTAGVWVWRSELKGGGVALTAVGSAMLLFDGWIAIDGYGLDGPWPWAALLLILSAVYWFTETRLTGRFFGATGVAAQVGWWWLLGQGLGWTPAPRLAGIALVAVAWSFVAEAVRGREEFSSLASVMRVAAPVVASVAAAGILLDVGIGPPRWVDVLSALVAAAALTAIVDRFGPPWRGFAALAWAPLLFSVALMVDFGGVGWGHVGVLAVAAFATGAYELTRGGIGHGVAALVYEAAAWLALAGVLSLAGDATLALFVIVAAVWFVSARLMDDRLTLGGATTSHSRAFAPVVAAGGWVVLAVVTLFVPEAVRVARLEGWTLVVPRDGAWVAVFTLGWAAGARLMRAWPAAIVAIAGSFLTAGLLALGFVPEMHPAYVGCILAALAALWLHVPRAGEALSAPLAGWLTSWLAGGSLFLFGLALWFTGPVHAEWPVVALFAALVALWASEEVRFGDRFPTVASALSLVVAAVVAGDLLDVGGLVLGGGWGGIAGAFAGALVCAGAFAASRLLGRTSRVSGRALAGALASTGAAWWPAVMLIGPRYAEVAPYLAVGFAVSAVAWALCALALRSMWLFAVSALAVWVSLLASLSWMIAPPWLTLVALTLYAAALFVPTLAGPRRPAVAGPLATAALVVAVGTVFLGVNSVSGVELWHMWADIGEWGLTLAFAVLGALLVLSAAPYRFEPAEYAGGLALVAAAWTALGAVDIAVLEPYFVLLALYIAGSAYRFASRAAEREVPVVADWAAVVCATWFPALLAVSANTPADAFTHALWAVGLSLGAIAAGIALRVRGYLFGGVAALVFVSVWRSFFLLVEFWWVVLGLIGIAMLVIALTWERQQQLLARTGSIVREYFGSWR